MAATFPQLEVRGRQLECVGLDPHPHLDLLAQAAHR